MLILNFKEIAPDTLEKLLEEIVTRDGTDYGDIEVSVEAKIKQLMQQLRSGKASLCYDNETETCNVLSTEEALKLSE